MPIGYRRIVGFTLIEVLVCLGIIGVLVGLLLPAVQSAREAARRSRCVANLHQLGVGVAHYVEIWGGFPPAFSIGESRNGYGHCYSPQSLLLPYIEQIQVFNQINFEASDMILSNLSGENLTVTKYRIGVFVCPSDFRSAFVDFGSINYRANQGLCQSCDEQDQGAFYFGRLATPASFLDGLSNTIAFSEKPIGSGSVQAYSAFVDWIGGQQPPRDLTRTSSDWVEFCSSLRDSSLAQFDAGRTWLLCGGAYTHFFVSAPPNSLVPDCGNRSNGGTGVFVARSYHVGGVNALMCDGSAKWFRSSVNLQLWKSLGTRSRGDIADFE